MENENEEPGFLPIGSRLPTTSPSPQNSGSTASPSPNNSATTGLPRPEQRPFTPTGMQHGATGADAKPHLPARYSAADLQQESRRDLRLRLPRGKPNETKIASHVSVLLSHYWAAEEDPRLRAALARDWVGDLAEFHESVVAEACAEWRRGSSRRPTPADIRGLCIDATHAPAPPRRPVPTRVETPEEVAAQVRQRQEMGEKFGGLLKMMRGEIPWPPK